MTYVRYLGKRNLKVLIAQFKDGKRCEWEGGDTRG